MLTASGRTKGIKPVFACVSSRSNRRIPGYSRQTSLAYSWRGGTTRPATSAQGPVVIICCSKLRATLY